jgi:hypothetical protein
MVRKNDFLKTFFSEILEVFGKPGFPLATFWLHYGSIMERSQNVAKKLPSTFP